MRICPECHGEVADGMRFCPSCGKYMPLIQNPAPAPAATEIPNENFDRTPEYAEPSTEPFVNENGFTAASIASSLSEPALQYEAHSAPQADPAPKPSTEFYGVPNSVYVPNETKTPSVWSFVLTFFLCSLPIVNIIYIIALACGATEYPAKKNMARGAFIYALLQLLVTVILLIVLALIFGQGEFNAIVDGIRQYIPSAF